MQAYHSEGTNIAKAGSLGEPRASHTICSIQAFRWDDDGYYQGSRSNVIPSFKVLGKCPLVLAARSFHGIELGRHNIFARVRQTSLFAAFSEAVQDLHLCDVPITLS